MNLFLQLLPFLALAAILAVGTGVYIWRKSRQRRASRVAPVTAEVEVGQPESPFPPPSFEAAPLAAAGPGQILCLYTMGIAPARIATALGRPLQEVEIVLKVSETKQRRFAATPQLS